MNQEIVYTFDKTQLEAIEQVLALITQTAQVRVLRLLIQGFIKNYANYEVIGITNVGDIGYNANGLGYTVGLPA